MQETNQTYFQRALADVQQLKLVSTDSIEMLVQQYPWFAKAHQLLAKKYQIEQPEKFNQQLQLAALHALDRKELFKLIEYTIIETEPAIVEQKTEIKITEIIAPILLQEEPKVLQDEKSSIEIDLNLNDEKRRDEFLIPEFSITSLHLDEQQMPIVADEFKEVKNENLEIVVKNIESKIILPTELANKEMEQTKNSEEIKTEKSFTSWLHQFSKGSAIHQDKTLSKRKEDNLKQAKALMNEFIGNDEDDSEPDDLKVNLAELMSFSMQRHDEFVTETMAKVYIQQEKFDKAIATYEKLSLLKPEKSVFFAAQIVELKNKIQ